MTRRSLAVPVLAGLLLAVPVICAAIDDIAARERVGVRVGGLATFDGLNDAYGNGWSLTLFLTERITRPLLLDIRLGALYPGDLVYEDLDDRLLNSAGIQGSMRILYLSIGPMLARSLGGAYATYASAGVGIYSVSMVFTDVLTPFDLSDQYFGFNGGLGLQRRLSGNWSVEASTTVHYFPIDKSINDIYYAFTDGADAPLILDIALGLTVDLR